MARPRHPKKELERVLRDGEAQGWLVKKARRYFKMYCRCADKHMKTVHLSPSDPNYTKNLLGILRRETCWEAEK